MSGGAETALVGGSAVWGGAWLVSVLALFFSGVVLSMLVCSCGGLRVPQVGARRTRGGARGYGLCGASARRGPARPCMPTCNEAKPLCETRW